MTRNNWIWIALVILAAVYLSYYWRTVTVITILQTTLADFQFDMLYEKQPIVIQDVVAVLAQIITAWFPKNKQDDFSIGALAAPGEPGATWTQNRHKYLLIHAVTEGDIYLVNSSAVMGADGTPDPESQALLGIHLRPGQIVILPYKMRYLPADGFIAHAVGVHDWITRMI